MPVGITETRQHIVRAVGLHVAISTKVLSGVECTLNTDCYGRNMCYRNKEIEGERKVEWK